MKNIKLRIGYMIPNIFFWLMSIGFSIWVFLNVEGLKQIDAYSSWVLRLVFLYLISLLGSFQIWLWIKQGKI